MLLLKLLSRLPLTILYWLSDFLYFCTYRVIKYRRKIVYKNLLNSFPEKSENEIKKIEKQFYKNLCDYGVETLKLLSISEADLVKRMRYTNPEAMGVYTSKGQSVIMLSSHQFNWEWLLVSGSISLPAPIDFVYQPVQNNFFNKLMLEARTRFGTYAIKRNKVAREFAKRKNILRGIAIVADQYPSRNDKVYQTTFLNQDTAFFYGSQQLATLTQYPVLYGSIKRIKRGYYECTLIEISKPPYGKDDDEVLRNYAKAVEAIIQQEPSGWLWSHKRWKKRHFLNK